MRSKGSASFAIWDQPLPDCQHLGPSSTPGIGRKGRPSASTTTPEWPLPATWPVFEKIFTYSSFFFCHKLLFVDKTCRKTNKSCQQKAFLACVPSCDIRLDKSQVSVGTRRPFGCPVRSGSGGKIRTSGGHPELATFWP